MEKLPHTKVLLLELIHSMHGAEKELCETLPKLKDSVLALDLREFIEKEAAEKKKQQGQLEIVFALLREEPSRIYDDVVHYLSQAKDHLTEKYGRNEVSDSLMIVFNHAISIYLINMHQKAISYSSVLGYNEITRILKRSLHVEMEMKEKLRMLEWSHIHLERMESGTNLDRNIITLN
ncbi:hypothetical protein C900_02419 [Fulvivirga imtechensis AK7]|uniref:Uncharacterized protein n=1 Tax=Fulvivirga imtechensis AK7 TaxID=1237149 RepID=L8JRK7_9BACT|nr:DUF892 family protein [Fulvivirga imtechensis]ELR71611.1 hypothetical protein C900_02419 [Fulvivirga imtechensis AK7]